jgi:hypothetical protein
MMRIQAMMFAMSEAPSPLICRSSGLLCMFVNWIANVRRNLVLDIRRGRDGRTAGSSPGPPWPFDVHVVTRTIQPHATANGQAPRTDMPHCKSEAPEVPSRLSDFDSSLRIFGRVLSGSGRNHFLSDHRTVQMQQNRPMRVVGPHRSELGSPRACAWPTCSIGSANCVV